MTFLLMTSCEEVYEFDNSDFVSKLVINELFNDNSPWSIEVSNSTNILDPTTSTEFITDAKVEIYDQNDVFKYELYHQGLGIYGQDDFSPSPKRGYSVKVSAPGYEAVIATSFVPEKSKLQINHFSIIPNEKTEDVEVDFVIEDRSKLDSYYIWEIVNIEGDAEGSSSENLNQLSQTWIDDLTNNPNDLIKVQREILENNSFGDGTYSGTYSSLSGNRRISPGFGSGETELFNYSHEMTTPSSKLDPKDNQPEDINQGDVSDGNSSEGGETEKVEFKYELRVMAISKELFDYYSSVEEYYRNKDNNHSNQPPTEIYTNVSGGLGIFAGFSESVLKF